MKKYNITISAVCPPEKRWEWEQEIHNGYTLTVLGHTVKLEGRNRTEEDFDRLQPLIREFTDHHVHVEEAKPDAKEDRQTPPSLGENRLEQGVRPRLKGALVLCDGYTQRNLARTDSCGATKYTCALWAECQRRIRAGSDA